MNKLVFEVNNGRKLELVQREDNGTTLICSLDAPGNEAYISADDFVQLINLYRYCKRYDIQNDWINPNGKNAEVWKMVTLDFAQWAALWYVGGMVSGFLLCLVWLNDRAEQ